MVPDFNDICQRYGWSADQFASVTKLYGWEPFTLHPSRSAGASTEIGGLFIYRWAAFGNSIFQLCNTVAICKAYGIPRIYYKEDHEILLLDKVGTTDGVSFIKLAPNELQNLPFHVISSTYFHDTPFCLQLNPRLQIIETIIRRMLPDGYLDRECALDPGILVAHFRSGDIFSALIHPGYGQPPYSYYLTALDTVKPREVLVVSYDLSNPTTSIFVNECVARGIPIKMQCSSLTEDLRTLLSARTLVSSIGTFCWMAACLSENLNNYWFFERLPGRGLTDRPGVLFQRAIDKRGDYVSNVLSNNWAMTPEQVEMMTSYPVDNLTIESISCS